ncbi:hypothetical protein [Sulfurimonas sp. HSL3-7]|uniref:hypothetical protein n=1 Tax=Sulfonitrofixus jiaomeiensis TaxID=3131938 RepID=UPI0031F7DFF9
MQWRMTYNNIDGAACSARGIALRGSKEELESLAQELEGTICNVMIEENRTFSKREKRCDR